MLAELLFQMQPQRSHLSLKLPHRVFNVPICLVVTLRAGLGRVFYPFAGLCRRVFQGNHSVFIIAEINEPPHPRTLHKSGEEFLPIVRYPFCW